MGVRTPSQATHRLSVGLACIDRARAIPELAGVLEPLPVPPRVTSFLLLRPAAYPRSIEVAVEWSGRYGSRGNSRKTSRGTGGSFESVFGFGKPKSSSKPESKIEPNTVLAPSTDHSSSAAGDVRIALLARIVRTRTYRATSLDGRFAHVWTSRNRLLWNYSGAIRVKTAATPLAGANLVACATRHGHRLMAVVLGSTKQNRFSDGAALLNYGWQLEGLGQAR